MGNMRFKVGDRVKIKSLDWYNENKNDHHNIVLADGWYFTEPMSNFCGKELIIEKISRATNPPHYIMKDNTFAWTDEMIEGLVEEEEVGLVDKLSSRWVNEFSLPDGYIFTDENGNVINTTKIVLEKVNTLKTQSDNMETETHRGYCTTEEETTNKSKKVAWFSFEDNDFADKVELALSNRELIQEDGKWFVVKKKKEYPKTYEECVHVLEGENRMSLEQMNTFRKLIDARNAYWKLYGEELGLGKPWKPNWEDEHQGKWVITLDLGYIVTGYVFGKNHILAFPTKEMRDAFKENFDPDIEICKEFL